MPTLNPNTSALRRITFIDLAVVLSLPPHVLYSVVNARDFPPPVARYGRPQVWCLDDVCNWLKRHDWRTDAEAVGKFSNHETE